MPVSTRTIQTSSPAFFSGRTISVQSISTVLRTRFTERPSGVSLQSGSPASSPATPATPSATSSAGSTSTRLTPSAHWAVTMPASCPSAVSTGLPKGAGSVRSSSRKRRPFRTNSSAASTPRLTREPSRSPKRTMQEDAGVSSPQARSGQAPQRAGFSPGSKNTTANRPLLSCTTASAVQADSPSVTAS